MHRLDRETSGAARRRAHEAAHRLLQRRSRDDEIEREYLALVEGRPPARTGTIDAPIGRDPRVRTRMAVGGASAREARTHFTLERALPRQPRCCGCAWTRGGPTRSASTCEAIGHPVCGDPRVRHGAGLLGLERQFLHAASLEFEHPLTGEHDRGRSRRCPPISQLALERARSG